MEAINDYSWLKQMLTERVLERFQHGEFRAVALKVQPSERNPASQYRYRLLLFHADDNKPSFAFNLESSILGSFCLTEQTGTEHRTFGSADETMTYERFREWAMRRVEAVVPQRGEIRASSVPSAERTPAEGKPPVRPRRKARSR